MRPVIEGKSTPILEMKKMIARVAGAKTNILITGESGTGKELVARAIHEQSPMKDKAFVPVNCGAIPENLIESEFFGHKKGSFTGAISDKPGLFEAADGGTLFLDEVGELPLALQSKLLRAIQEKMVRRVGGLDDIHVDVRIIAATNRDLEQQVKDGKFREDLFYRLNVIQIKTPSLRERGHDEIEYLAKHFLDKFNAKYGKKVLGFEKDAMQAVREHSWPGNIRELENALERAVTMESGEKITRAAIEPSLQSMLLAGAVSGAISLPIPNFTIINLDLEKHLAEYEAHLIRLALTYSKGDRNQASKLLGLNPAQLSTRMRKCGILK